MIGFGDGYGLPTVWNMWWKERQLCTSYSSNAVLKLTWNELELKVCKKKYDKGFVFLRYKELLQTNRRRQTLQGRIWADDTNVKLI